MYKGSRSEVVDAKDPKSTECMFWRVGTISEHAEELRADKYCPEDWQDANIRPILCQDEKEPENFRPISLTPITRNIQE